MKFFGWIIKYFNFGKKYRKREGEYHNKSKKLGTSGELLMLVFYTALPLLSLWGAFKLPWEGEILILKIFCFLGILFIFQAPAELMITGIVALRHRAKMKLKNKVTGEILGKTTEVLSGQELSEEAKDKVENYEAKGTANRYDLVVGILGIVLSVAVVVAFVTLFFVFLSSVAG